MLKWCILRLLHMMKPQSTLEECAIKGIKENCMIVSTKECVIFCNGMKTILPTLLMFRKTQ
jgi:hypothetical protein